MNRSKGRQSAHHHERAFTIVEIIVVVVIIGVLATVIAPRLIGRIGQAKQSTAASNAAVLANAVKIFSADCGLPAEGSTIDVLWEAPSDLGAGVWQGPYVDSKEKLLDPWGNPFILVLPGQKNIDFDIVSYGADAKPGGEGDAADIIKP